MAEARKLSVPELREVVSDPAELAKGTEVYDRGGLSHLSRFQNRLYAEAAGSGPSAYKVNITFGETASEVKARCSCFASRTRPFCKHAAALIVAWARAPESFVVAEEAPPGMAGEAKKKAVKTGKTEAKELIRRGVEQAGTLVRELAVAGTASIAADRLEQIRSLGETLRENRLRRLSARTLDLVNLLSSTPDGVEYADLLTDMVLTVRKLEKHVAGEPLEDRHVEELLGKTWRKTDRRPAADLKLVEYGFRSWTTSDNFLIRESRFFDLGSGQHYSEKQILPQFLVKRTEPKPSYAATVLHGARGSVYPGYSPLRLDLEAPGELLPLSAEALELLVAQSQGDVGAALSAFQEHRKDVFAPDELPVALAVDTVFAGSGRLQVVDASDRALFLPEDRGLAERLATSLREAKLRALLGDVVVSGALPTFYPLATVVEGPKGLALSTLAAPELGSSASARVRTEAGGSWVDVARAAGVSPAAVSIGEIREELAGALVTGLTGLAPRFTDPLVARLRDLGLEKQAEILQVTATKPDPADRLDDFVKLYQILGIALVRVSGAATVDRKSLTSVPTYECVFVRNPEKTLPPAHVAAYCAQGKLNRYEAAVHYARWYEALSAKELASSIYPTWADGSASRYVARAFASRGEEALAAAEKALQSKKGRVAKMTAIRVLEAVCGTAPESPPAARARQILARVRGDARDSGLRALAASAVEAIESRGRETRDQRAEPVQQLAQRLLGAPRLDERVRAVQAMENLGHLGALPALRTAFFSDASKDVRREAAYVLAELGDVEMVETWVALLAARKQDEESAKVAANALGRLGDVRGVHELLAAFAEGWKPTVVAEAIRALGEAAIEPLVALIEDRPDLANRKAALGVLAELPAQDLSDFLVDRLAGLGEEKLAARAALYLKLAAVHIGSHRAVAQAILDGSGRRGLAGEKSVLKAARAALKERDPA